MLFDQAMPGEHVQGGLLYGHDIIRGENAHVGQDGQAGEAEAIADGGDLGGDVNEDALAWLEGT